MAGAATFLLMMWRYNHQEMEMTTPLQNSARKIPARLQRIHRILPIAQSNDEEDDDDDWNWGSDEEDVVEEVTDASRKEEELRETKGTEMRSPAPKVQGGNVLDSLLEISLLQSSLRDFDLFRHHGKYTPLIAQLCEQLIKDTAVPSGLQAVQDYSIESKLASGVSKIAGSLSGFRGMLSGADSSEQQSSATSETERIRPVVIVFVVGGTTGSELASIEDVISRTLCEDVQLIIGSTGIADADTIAQHVVPFW